jgi:hypothetical protein
MLIVQFTLSKLLLMTNPEGASSLSRTLHSDLSLFTNDEETRKVTPRNLRHMNVSTAFHGGAPLPARVSRIYSWRFVI